MKSRHGETGMANRARPPIDRREFLRKSLGGASWLLGAAILPACHERGAFGPAGGLANVGPLQPPDANGVMLPPGFTSRIVARSGIAPATGGAYLWPPAPDGGAVFDTGDGGWIYVSNSEIPSGGGGAGALRFDASASVIDAYPILSGTSRNCAGGRTPWGTWLSCEEVPSGLVFECDAFGLVPAAARPSLGTFSHEAVAVDPVNGHLYLTEDEPDGGLYRFRPSSPLPDLTSGVLEIAEVTGAGAGAVAWHPIPDPAGSPTPTRYQVAQATPFNRGEGIVYFGGAIFIATTGDDRVWRLDVAAGAISILYDPATNPNPILSGVDNLETSPAGDVLAAEDGGDMQIVAVTPAGRTVPICQLAGHAASEITGPAFTPDFRRLYFSSQRGTTGSPSDGMTFEIEGPFAP